MAAISRKNKIYIYIFVKWAWSKITSEKNSFISHYLNELLDSENGTKKKNISMGANFRKEVRSLDGYILGTINI